MVNPKQSKNKNTRFSYKDRHELKSKEIKKSLTHRATLRRKYFKMLENEGLSSNAGEAKEREGASGDHESEEASLSEKPEHGESREHEAREKTNVKQTKKALPYIERAKKVKELKEKRRQEKLKQIRDQLKASESKTLQRQKEKEILSQKTKRGQPLMGPRINNLLDKIRKDMK
ncbi:Piso0_005585 [Millerozyma farinosa CBS 7064]|uniref:rRNA-processing protein FYV7 n=1 Tax=Pichia sorbitophila (strain ATCC MYA-4447 / BCRC 22081 / CBS 7064 / NBRC 10061 / NRRL Y-12695) TaxID=559304 RepID=G8XZD9_PICSO|nr:Piso0_005585 [Millerozyma farinosa CBS 7064]